MNYLSVFLKKREYKFYEFHSPGKFELSLKNGVE
jgi:hypothetical protein